MSKATKPAVIPDAHMQDVRSAHKAIADALPVLAALEACGVDCTEERAAFEHYDRKLRQIQEHFTTQK